MLVALVLSTSVASAATHAVLPGGSIQEKIDLAQPGDIIAIFGGTYSENLTISKPVRLVEVDGAEVEIAGRITFDALADPPAFEGFKAGAPGNGIAVNGCTGLVLKDIDGSNGPGLSITGVSEVSVVGGVYPQIDQDGGILSVSHARIEGDFNSTVNSDRTVAYRATIGGRGTWYSRDVWIGYSTAWVFHFYGNDGKRVLVGAEVVGPLYGGPSVIFGGVGNSILMSNSIIDNGQYTSNANGGPVWYGSSAAVRIEAGNEAVIANN